MDPCDITSLEDEVLEFLLSWNPERNEVVWDTDKETAPGAGSGDKDIGVDKVQVLGGGLCIPGNEGCKWKDNNEYGKPGGSSNGRSSPAQGRKHSTAATTAIGPIRRNTRGRPAASVETETSKPKTYVEELEAIWPSKYLKLKNDIEQARKSR